MGYYKEPGHVAKAMAKVRLLVLEELEKRLAHHQAKATPGHICRACGGDTNKGCAGAHDGCPFNKETGRCSIG